MFYILVVQSTDKNFMVPVGGAIITCPDPKTITEISRLYPGRASISPVLDLFITLLSMGEEGLLKIWGERQRLLLLLAEKLKCFAQSRNENILFSPQNSISIGVTLDTLSRKREMPSKSEDANAAKASVIESDEGQGQGQGSGSGSAGNGKGCSVLARTDKDEEDCKSASHPCDVNATGSSNLTAPSRNYLHGTVQPKTTAFIDGNKDKESISFFGSMLFQRNVSGCRVVPQSDTVTEINGTQFVSWGAHMSHYPVSYFTAACSVGLTEEEIILFMDRIEKVWKKFEKKTYMMTYSEELGGNSIPQTKLTDPATLFIKPSFDKKAVSTAYNSVEQPVQEHNDDYLT